jgi:hypothetical protein
MNKALKVRDAKRPEIPPDREKGKNSLLLAFRSARGRAIQYGSACCLSEESDYLSEGSDYSLFTFNGVQICAEPG